MIDAVLAVMLMMQASVAPPEPAAQPEAEVQGVVEQTTAPAEQPAEDPMVCRSERVVGSNIPVRTCQRRSEMQARSERTGQQMRDRRGLTRVLSEYSRPTNN